MTTFDDLPKPSIEDLKRSAALSQVIQQAIHEHQGFIAFSNFMALALYHPTLGYYNADSMVLGKQGDFTTAPEISPLFGQCLGEQCAELLVQLHSASILEIGAGSGRLASDLLTTLKNKRSLPQHYYILEISPSLRRQQQQLLQTMHPDLIASIHWIEVLPVNFEGIIIANEVLDALPFDCFYLDNGIHERGVTWKSGEFDWQLRPATEHTFIDTVSGLQQHYALPNGYHAEIRPQLANFLVALMQSLNRGVILLADYGYSQREYYHPERYQGTLTCFYRHHRHSNPLILPGLQDITAHVDFTQVVEIGVEQGCQLLGYTTQAGFLLSCGLIEAATALEATMSAAEQVNLHHAIKLLTLPTEQGERVKFMAFGKKMAVDLMGFKLQDRRREL